MGTRRDTEEIMAKGHMETVGSKEAEKIWNAIVE